MERIGVATIALLATVVMLTTGISGIVFGTQTPTPNAATQMTPEEQTSANLNMHLNSFQGMFEKYLDKNGINIALLNSTQKTALLYKFVNNNSVAKSMLDNITAGETNLAMMQHDTMAPTNGPDPQLLAYIVTLKVWPGITYGHEYYGYGVWYNYYYDSNGNYVWTGNMNIEATGIIEQMLEAFDSYDIMGGLMAILYLLSEEIFPGAAILQLMVDAMALYDLEVGVGNMESTINSNVNNWGHYLELGYRETVLLDGASNSDVVYAWNSTSSTWENVILNYPTYDFQISDSVSTFLSNHDSNYWYWEPVQMTEPSY